jgi:hypothetical protein
MLGMLRVLAKFRCNQWSVRGIEILVQPDQDAGSFRGKCVAKAPVKAFRATADYREGETPPARSADGVVDSIDRISSRIRC